MTIKKRGIRAALAAAMVFANVAHLSADGTLAAMKTIDAFSETPHTDGTWINDLAACMDARVRVKKAAPQVDPYDLMRRALVELCYNRPSMK